jgi:hypothetical protein
MDLTCDLPNRLATELAKEYLRYLRESSLLVAESPLAQHQLPDEITLQIHWLEGLWGREFNDDEGNSVTIIDPGQWNRSAGPDFLNATISLNGEEIRGDIELDPIPENWEEHQHGSNPNFDHVVLHVACFPASAGWFTRNSQHKHIPLVVIPEQIIQQSVALPSRRDYTPPEGICALTFQSMTLAQIEHILQTAAAYRLASKRKQWLVLSSNFGKEQALYELIAETLGYHSNKLTMRHLARRAPLQHLHDQSEAILFGTAGFLSPVLPDSTTSEARQYHKNLWSSWWPCREQWELSNGRQLTWDMAGVRPANHPQRRVASLAILANKMRTWRSLCTMERAKDLVAFLTSITHPYWSFHYTLPSAKQATPIALIGKNRAQDFVINHVTAIDDSESAWTAYLQLPAEGMNSKVQRAIARLFGRRTDMQRLLSKAYVHQALLQIEHDFCLNTSCASCSLPSQCQQWK